MENNKIFGRFSLPGKATVLKFIIVIAVVAVIIWFVKFRVMTETPVIFTPLEESAIPQQMVSQIIPEYRDLERALACIVNDKVYVMVTRGEKPTAGYGVEIHSMEKDGEGTSERLIVNAVFTDPQAGTSLTQAVTYPIAVAETDMEYLPPKIELKIKYSD